MCYPQRLEAQHRVHAALLDAAENLLNLGTSDSLQTRISQKRGFGGPHQSHAHATRTPRARHAASANVMRETLLLPRRLLASLRAEGPRTARQHRPRGHGTACTLRMLTLGAGAGASLFLKVRSWDRRGGHKRGASDKRRVDYRERECKMRARRQMRSA